MAYSNPDAETQDRLAEDQDRIAFEQRLITVADAIDAARYAHPQNPRERPRSFSDADASDREYAIRLARAAIAALTPDKGA